MGGLFRRRKVVDKVRGDFSFFLFFPFAFFSLIQTKKKREGYGGGFNEAFLFDSGLT